VWAPAQGRDGTAQVGWLAPHRRRRAACYGRSGREEQGAQEVPRLAGGWGGDGRSSGGAEANHWASMRLALTAAPTAASRHHPQNFPQGSACNRPHQLRLLPYDLRAGRSGNTA
jgi:hypothetical protein